MPTETVAEKSEVSQEFQYTHKSFELVFANFCSQYTNALETLSGGNAKDGTDSKFMGLPASASIQQMGHRLNEVAQIMGDAPRWEDDQEEGTSMREALLLSARYLAWHATMGGITQQYIDKLKEHIKSETPKSSLNGGSHQNLGRLSYHRDKGLAILRAQNHALRDYFDSGLANTLGNDSPEKMSQLLNHVPYLKDRHREDIVDGIPLEIASKRYVEQLLKNGGNQDVGVAFGSDEHDSRAGDLVILNADETMFIDVKSSIPEEFSDKSKALAEDYERGYKWLNSKDREHKVVVWAYSNPAVERGRFILADDRFANNLRLVIGAMGV